MDWRRPLRRYWKGRSLFGRQGVQHKTPRQIRQVIFNKVQRRPDLWGPEVEFRPGTKMIFYFRNPVCVHLSREDYRRKHKPARSIWAENETNFAGLLDEAARLIETYHRLQERVPCLVMSHEYFCCQHNGAMSQLQQFLEIKDEAPIDPRSFFQVDRSTGGRLVEQTSDNGVPYLVSQSTQNRVEGYGNFNPLRKMNLENIRSDQWKSVVAIDRLMGQIRNRLGGAFADYYWQSNFDQNLALETDLVEVST